MKLTRDGWAGLAALAASLFLFFQTLGLKDSPLVPIGPGFYPRIILGITAVLAAMLVFFSLREGGKRRDKGGENFALVFVVFVVFGVYVGALPFLGYRIATFLFVAGLHALLEPPRSARGWAAVAANALVTTVASYVLFEKYLTVLLPRGLWTDF